MAEPGQRAIVHLDADAFLPRSSRRLMRYPHPCLEPCLRGTYGLVVYEEHILQFCAAFAVQNSIPESDQ
jgi:DNA polymerase III alpha subunit